ncbi:MAG TPA: FG-GAP-like repeat-containing protein [Terriglobales bacterium]|nr:FG-GAP-like repeat-containing protein [Terriglobales bacterium]
MRIRTAKQSLLFLLIALAMACTTRGKSAPQLTLKDAMARLQANDLAGAATILEQVTKSEPKNGRAWRTLGLVELKRKNLDAAAVAFQHALDVDPAVPTPMFQLAILSAVKQDKDGMFNWLSKAKASRNVDMTQMEITPEIARYEGDARYPALLPTRKDFDDPFLEPVTIVHEWDGETANDQFGWIARNIGDVDGDGVPDFVTSAPTSKSAGENAGRIYVYSVKSGKLLWKADGYAQDQLGTGLEAAGDTNGDGIPDVVASAPGGGYANIYSGRDGRLLRTLKAENPTDDFGRHVEGVGDVNHDGYADVLVGAPNNSSAGAKAGRAYVYSGKDGSVLLTLNGERAGDNFGSAVAGFSDQHHMFLLVGAPGAGTNHAGRTYVYDSLLTTPKFMIEADETGAALGSMFLSVLGDVDGDGVPDVYASDWANSAKGPSTGRVYIHSGKDGHRLFAFTGETAGEGFGTSPSVAGDVDGDGHADVIVGAWQYAGAAISGGRAYLYSGRDGHLIRTYTCRTPGDTFGFDAVTMGDINGDGMSDFLITSGWSGVHGYHSGRVFLISSGIRRQKP